MFGYGIYYNHSTVDSIKENYNGTISAINVINDTVIHYKNEDGELVAKIFTITMDNYKDFLTYKN